MTLSKAVHFACDLCSSLVFPPPSPPPLYPFSPLPSSLPLLLCISSADEPALHDEWRVAKQDCKSKLAARVKALTGITINTSALFDVQVGVRSGRCVCV